MGQFLTDIKTIRERARREINEGAVTPDYGLDKDQVCKILNEALATEIVCVLRYKFHYFMASGIHKEGVAAEFLQHSIEEQAHADKIAERIKQLGGKPEMNPAVVAVRAHAEYVEGDSLVDMIKENLVAERIAIQTYREMVKFFGDKDSTSRVMMEGILAQEEEHADDMADLLFAVKPDDVEETTKLYAPDEVAAKSRAGKKVTKENAKSAQKPDSKKKAAKK
ncbi:MAG TPA: ferritin-like domain-containing protein [Pyrinomonadaceae bacterium]|jgi:bacterioferritin|nr:ferritin-like domain-containing protein [Pyrinomonadaceae bacterium]